MFGVPEMDWSYNGKNILSYIDIYLKMMSFWRTKYDSMIHDDGVILFNFGFQLHVLICSRLILKSIYIFHFANF